MTLRAMRALSVAVLAAGVMLLAAVPIDAEKTTRSDQVDRVLGQWNTPDSPGEDPRIGGRWSARTPSGHSYRHPIRVARKDGFAGI